VLPPHDISHALLVGHWMPRAPQTLNLDFIHRRLEPKNNQSKRARKTILKKEFKAFSAFAAAAGFLVTLVYHNSTCPAFLEFIMAALLTVRTHPKP
jgi:hypothetical protein